MSSYTERKPFDVKLTPDQRHELALWLQEELHGAISAKSATDEEITYWHALYEQARTRGRKPWPDAADLTSYLASEKVDAMHARMMRTTWVEPIWAVEGFGQAANNAPIVEEVHQWWAERDRLQSTVDKLALISLIEPRGLIEVCEGAETITKRTTMMAAMALAPNDMGQMVPVYEADGTPQYQRDPQGNYVKAEPGMAAGEIEVDIDEPVRTGPVERVIPYRDSVILPGHARDKEEIWGYGKRFYRRLPEIQAQAKRKVYDADAVEELTPTSDREADPALSRSNAAIAPQDGPTAEKELWELLVLVDLSKVIRHGTVPKEARGERWYVITLHAQHPTILRLQHDDFERPRFVPVILFPRTDRATEGFSYVGHKLITIIEEHTAWRNMAADRTSMVVQSPIKKLVGALWDEHEQPWGPKAVITVRDHREIEPVVVPDLTAAVFTHIQMLERNADRVSGTNDIASGQVTTDAKTLGEVQMATEQSFVRMDLVIRRFQEVMEEIGQLRNMIYARQLKDQQDGIDPPQSLMTGLQARNVPLPNGKITSDLLEGPYRFKPRGSVETADPKAMRADFVQALGYLPQMIQLGPMLAQVFGPEAPRALMDQFVRLFRLPNRQAFLSSPSVQQAMLPPDPMAAIAGMQQLPSMPMGQGGPPMLPPGPPA